MILYNTIMNKSKNKFNKLKVLIVGSGIIGKFNALELSNHGFDITIIDEKEENNSSNAALGILMGKIYQKRRGRSWLLREQSLELWPEWLRLLNKYNSQLKIEKPLFQLTTNYEKFNRLKAFANNYPEDNLEIIEENSNQLNQINKFFKGNKLNGIISHIDGRINPKILLETMNIFLKEKHIKTINGQINKIDQKDNLWFAQLKTGEILESQVIVLCNSLESIKLINPDICDIKLKPVLGQAIEIYYEEDNFNFLSLPKHININGKNLIPLSKSRLVIGSTDEYSLTPNEFCINEMISFLDEKPNWLNKKNITRKWFGIRSKPDGEGSPLLKSLTRGLILCSGFYKNGILLGPACGKWTAKEILNHI